MRGRRDASAGAAAFVDATTEERNTDGTVIEHARQDPRQHLGRDADYLVAHADHEHARDPGITTISSRDVDEPPRVIEGAIQGGGGRGEDRAFDHRAREEIQSAFERRGLALERWADIS